MGPVPKTIVDVAEAYQFTVPVPIAVKVVLLLAQIV